MHLLAMTADDLKLTLTVVQIALSVVVMIIVGIINGKTKRIDTLESDLKKAATDAIENKLGQLRAEQAGPMKMIDQQIGQIQGRLDRGDERFRRLEEHDSKVSIQLVQDISAVRESMVTKSDLREMVKELREEMNR